MMTTAPTTAPANGATTALARGTKALFLAALATVPFMQPFTFHVLGSAVQPADALFGLVGAAWVLSLATGAMKLRRGKFYGLLGLFLGAICLTTLLAPTRSVGRLVIELYLMGLGVLAYNMVRSADDLRRTWAVWSGTAMFTATAILVSVALFYLAGIKDPKSNLVLWTAGSLPVGNYPRVRGFFLNGNMTGSYLAVSACFAVGLAGLWERYRKVALVAALCMAAAALFTLSTALGGLAIATGMFAWQLQRASRKAPLLKALLPLGGLFALALLFYTATYPKRAEAGLTFEPSPRWLTWGSSWGSFLKHPLFGNGLGTNLADVHYFAARGVHEHLTDPHNAWLSVAGQMGVFGLAAFVALLVWLGRGLSVLPRAASGAARPVTFEETVPRLALAGALVVVLYQTFSCSLEDMRHVWLVFGLIAGVVDGEPATEREAAPAA